MNFIPKPRIYHFYIELAKKRINLPATTLKVIRRISKMQEQWEVLGNWLVENQCRIILKTSGSQLFDITAAPETIQEIAVNVLSNSWTIDEFMLYLSQKGLAVEGYTK
jgi:hypothetical protein